MVKVQRRCAALWPLLSLQCAPPPVRHHKTNNRSIIQSIDGRYATMIFTEGLMPAIHQLWWLLCWAVPNCAATCRALPCCVMVPYAMLCCAKLCYFKQACPDSVLYIKMLLC
jgi:hypothetical protein